MASPLAFTVRRSQHELITPAKPTPYEFKNLFDLDDQKGHWNQAPVIMFYRNSVLMAGRDPVKIIKEAIAETLVHYYPLAGGVREGPDGKLVVECNGEGMLFIEADIDVRLDQFGDVLQPPFPGMEDLLFDVPGSGRILDCPILLIQVTRLICGGFIFAIRLNHTISDAVGLVQFMTAVAEIACGVVTLSVQPVWSRELLAAREPPRVTCKHHVYQELHATNSVSIYDIPQLVVRSFFISLKDIASLRNHLPTHLSRCSKFDVLTACLWRIRTIALDLNPDDEVRVAWFFNARLKLSPPLAVGYYGNALGMMVAQSTVDELCQNPLDYAVELINRAKADMTDEFMRSTIDFLVANGRCSYTGGQTYYVSDLAHIGFTDIDFGWGKAVYGGSTGSGPLGTFCMPSRNTKDEEGMVVTMNLPGPCMERFAVEMEKVVKEVNLLLQNKNILVMKRNKL